MADQPSPYSADRAAEWRDIAREAQRQSTEATAQALDSAQRLGQMADAVRALLYALPSAALQCGQCDDLAMHAWPSPNGGIRFACDAHNVSGSTEMDHAPDLRRLRALVAAPEPR